MHSAKTRRTAKRRPRDVPPFGKTLSDLMERKRMTVREAASIAGVGPSTIVSWRSGSLPEDYRAVKTLAKSLGVSFSYLLTGEEERGDPVSVSEVFRDGGNVFDGYAKITIHRLLPRKAGE